MGLASSQTDLLFANGFLTIVNLVGIWRWRWLGRQARDGRGGEQARHDSHGADAEPKMALGKMVGGRVADRECKPIGHVADSILGSDSHRIAYLVIGRGGVAAVGETLHAVAPNRLTLGDTIRLEGPHADLCALPALPADDWSGRKPRAA